MKMYARLDEQGTAIGESALCANCLTDPKNRAFATAADSTTEHQDCTGNDALACIICGQHALTGPYRSFVLDLHKSDPDMVESTYSELYGDSRAWEAATAQEQVQGALDMDALDGPQDWAFLNEFDRHLAATATNKPE